VSNTKTRTKTRWTRAFKLQALSRMEAAADVTALAAELGCRRELLYIWRRKVRAGGADALHPIGRPSTAAEPFDEASAPSSAGAAGSGQRQIEELQRKIGQQQLDLDFFRAALRHVREARLKKGGPGGTASTR
jgi:transposase